MKENLLGLDAIGLERFFEAQGEKRFRARQLLRWIHPTKFANTQGTGIGGMQSTRKMYVDALLGEQPPNDVLQEALPNVIAAHTVQSYLGGYGAMVHPVAACATAAVSVEEGVDKTRAEVHALVKKALAEGKTAPKYHALTRPARAEGEAWTGTFAVTGLSAPGASASHSPTMASRSSCEPSSIVSGFSIASSWASPLPAGSSWPGKMKNRAPSARTRSYSATVSSTWSVQSVFAHSQKKL